VFVLTVLFKTILLTMLGLHILHITYLLILYDSLMIVNCD
jgi:hypothetical protein